MIRNCVLIIFYDNVALKKEKIMKNQQELMEEYLFYGKLQRNLDEKTIRAYQTDLKQFFLFAGGTKLVSSKETIRQYILHLHATYKQKTVKRKIASLKAFLHIFRAGRDYRK